MTEIRCGKCNHCLSKDVKVGAGMFYMNPSKPLEIFQEVRKCPNCGAFNEITLELNIEVKIRILNEPISSGEGLTGKTNLYSA